MNTTEGATNPPMPPRRSEQWTYEHPTSIPEARHRWSWGPFAVWRDRDQLLKHDAFLMDSGCLLHLGTHRSLFTAINACRDVAGALQRARRHQEDA